MVWGALGVSDQCCQKENGRQGLRSPNHTCYLRTKFNYNQLRHTVLKITIHDFPVLSDKLWFHRCNCCQTLKYSDKYIYCAYINMINLKSYWSMNFKTFFDSFLYIGITWRLTLMQKLKILKKSYLTTLYFKSLKYHFFFSKDIELINKDIKNISDWFNKRFKILKLTASVCMGWTANSNAAKKLVNSFRNILHTL